MIEDGCAPSVPQWEGGATYDRLWQNKDIAQVITLALSHITSVGCVSVSVCVCVCVCVFAMV